MTTWIMAADGARGRLFEIAGPDRQLREIEDFVNPRGRANNRELTTGANGRYYSKGGKAGAHSAAHKITPVQHEVELFCKTLARYLDKARGKRLYDKLYLIAPPEFLGLMRENLSREVRKVTAEEINKGVAWFDARDIARYVHPRPAGGLNRRPWPAAPGPSSYGYDTEEPADPLIRPPGRAVDGGASGIRYCHCVIQDR